MGVAVVVSSDGLMERRTTVFHVTLTNGDMGDYLYAHAR